MGNTFKLIELVGTSKEGFAEATSAAIAEAAKSIHDMAWFEVVEQRGRIENDGVAEFQVKLKVAFKLVR